MKKDEIISSILKSSIPTYYNWKREKRPIIELLEKYFTNEELEEFLNTGKIEKLDNINHVNSLLIENYDQYIKKLIFDTNDDLFDENMWSTEYLKDNNFINKIIINIPVFVFFEYIFEDDNYGIDEITSRHKYELDYFASWIIRLCTKFKDDFSVHTNLNNLFKVDEHIMHIIKIFNKTKNFDYYYNNKVTELPDIHSLFEHTYKELKEIQKSLCTIEERNKYIFTLFKSHKMNQEIYFSINKLR